MVANTHDGISPDSVLVLVSDNHIVPLKYLRASLKTIQSMTVARHKSEECGSQPVLRERDNAADSSVIGTSRSLSN
jgi:hypothetical protein